MLDNIPGWLQVIMSLAACLFLMVAPVGLLFWQAARDQREVDRKARRR